MPKQRRAKPSAAAMAIGKQKIDELLSKPGFVLFVRHRDHVGGSRCWYCIEARKKLCAPGVLGGIYETNPDSEQQDPLDEGKVSVTMDDSSDNITASDSPNGVTQVTTETDTLTHGSNTQQDIVQVQENQSETSSSANLTQQSKSQNHQLEILPDVRDRLTVYELIPGTPENYYVADLAAVFTRDGKPVTSMPQGFCNGLHVGGCNDGGLTGIDGLGILPNIDKIAKAVREGKNGNLFSWCR